MKMINFNYDDNDVISDIIFNFYNSCNDNRLDYFVGLYINNKKFFEYIQRNFLINKISVNYILRLLNEYDDDFIVEEDDLITSVNTTRWI